MKLNSNYDNHDTFSHLQACLSVSGIPPKLTDEIIERNIAVSFEKGALVFGEGSIDDLLACVLAGYVKVYCAVGDGGRTLVRIAGPGELIGYSNYIDSKGRRARLFETQSLTKCVVALISRDHVARLLRSLDADSLIETMQALNTFWSQNLRWFATLLNLPFVERLEVVLSELALRAGIKDARGTILIPELAHEDLAEMIGCSRPMVSRLLAEMAANGLLMRTGKQYLLLNKWHFDARPDMPPTNAQSDGSQSKNNGSHQIARLKPAHTSYKQQRSVA